MTGCRSGQTNHEAQVRVCSWKDEVAERPVVQSCIPADLNIVPSLALFHCLVIISFQLHQRTKYVLMGICILIPALEENLSKDCNVQVSGLALAYQLG